MSATPVGLALKRWLRARGVWVQMGLYFAANGKMPVNAIDDAKRLKLADDWLTKLTKRHRRRGTRKKR